MSVRKPRKGSSTAKKTRANAAKRTAAAAGDKVAVKRKTSASPPAPENRTAATGKNSRTVTKKAGGQAGTGKAETAAKSPRKKAAAKVRAAVAAPPAKSRTISAGTNTAEKPETPLKGTRRSLKRKTASPVASRPARRKIPSLKSPVLGKGRWEDREKFPDLPKEYGENDLLIMAVDPGTVYAAWEITRDRLPAGEGDLALRMVDVAGGGSSRDIRVGERAGSGFFEIQMPGVDVVAEIGLLSSDRLFRPILRSPVVTFPRLPAFDELGIIGKLFESTIRAGY
jgi:Domain of unknown function (DUF4912)